MCSCSHHAASQPQPPPPAPSAAAGTPGPHDYAWPGASGSGREAVGPRGPEPVPRRGSGDRPPAAAPTPDVRGSRGNGAGSTPGLAAVGLSQAAWQSRQASHPSSPSPAMGTSPTSSASFPPAFEQPTAGEAPGQLVTLPGAEPAPLAHQCDNSPRLKWDTAAPSSARDKPCMAEAQHLPGWLQP